MFSCNLFFSIYLFIFFSFRKNIFQRFLDPFDDDDYETRE